MFRSTTLFEELVVDRSDQVNGNVYTKFGKIQFIHYQDIEQKPISDINQGP